jgi:hypothetical protein
LVSAIFAFNLGVVIDNVRIRGDVLSEDGTFAATRCADESEVTAIASVQEFIDGSKDKFTTNKVLAFSPNELLKFIWVGGGIDGGWRSRCSIHGDASIPSNRKKCTRPDCSPATMVTPSGATAQQFIGLSPVKLAITSPVSRFHLSKDIGWHSG